LPGGTTIREFQPADAEAISEALARRGLYVLTGRGVQHEVDSSPTRACARFWVAIKDADLVGWALAHLKWTSDPSVGHLEVVVVPDARGLGIGSALWGIAERHLLGLRPRKLDTSADHPDSIAFVERRGFDRTRHSIVSGLDVSAASVPAQDLPRGLRVVPLRDLSGLTDEFFELFLAAEQDVPADEPRGQMTFQEWNRVTLQHPDLELDGSFAVVEDQRLVAFALLIVDRDRRRAWNEMTGTLPSHRGRGLATIVKSATIRWAGANGIDRIVTNNDAENSPMLAINRRLGYRPVKMIVDYEREVV
jgi:GNAT superfamily N-acetyltransferase